METLLGEELPDEHYHDAGEHGLVWLLLNKMLHLIVLGYAIYGMIQFKVKFIHTVKLVKIIRSIIIIHSWYLAIKFALIAACMYYFNQELEIMQISMSDFNCSLKNAPFLFANASSHLGGPSGANFLLSGRDNKFALRLAEILDTFGGPYKLLGNRATLMYGFYAISIFVMLAIFPIELIYLDIGFNYIRFVLNDVGCLRELYANKQKHLDKLNLWSRTQNSSMLTLSMKKTTNQRDLRCRYASECHRIVSHLFNFSDPRGSLQSARTTDSTGSRKSSLLEGNMNAFLAASALVDPSPARTGGGGSSMATATTDLKLRQMFVAPIRSLKRSMSNNHQDQPSYSVKVANKNLRKFRPYVRSEIWFKVSMVVYPMFVFYYFSSLAIVIGAISVFFRQSLEAAITTCTDNQRKYAAASGLKFNRADLCTLYDRILFYETQYPVFALSCASSFYCSYYFGTMIELFIWLQEISQQLMLCKIVVEMSAEDAIMQMVAPLRPRIEGKVIDEDEAKDLGLLSGCFNQFGGIENWWTYFRLNRMTQSQRFKQYEIAALDMVSKKQTLLRSTFINMNLFFDELHETRFMTQTILGRTTQIAFGFALMVGITRSQFEKNIYYLTILLATCLAILNLYLILAALVNGSINKLLPQVHALISASMVAGNDHDLLEFWLRHIQAYGTDKDAMSYRIFGYKITWNSILSFNGAVSSAYYFTI